MSSPLATINDLPAELHDTILDLFVGDPGTLKACCLTCQLWLPRAQHNLHLRVGVNPRNSKALSLTLRNRPQLASGIQELTLHNVDRIPKPPKDLQLSGLIRLRLVSMDLSNPWVDVVVSASASSLQELSFRDCVAEDPTAFLHFTKELRQLKHLDIERCRSWLHDVSPIPDASLPELLSLSLRQRFEFSPVAVARGFLEHPTAFKKLCILNVLLVNSYMDTFNCFLGVVGPGLRELKIGVIPEAMFTPLPLTLVHCSDLRLLEFEMRLRRPVENVDHLHWLPALLETVQAPNLRRIKFVVKAQSATQKDLEAFDWDKVARTLAEERFGSLREVLFYVADGALVKDTVVPLIRKRLGVLDKRGLRVVHRLSQRE